MSAMYIYDHVRTARGKGRADGALHEVSPTELSRQVLDALKDRNTIEENVVDDVYFGCVSPVGEQGAVVTRTAVLASGLGEEVTGVQLNRFCGSGLESVNTAAAHVAAGGADLTIGGGVESMSRSADGC